MSDGYDHVEEDPSVLVMVPDGGHKILSRSFLEMMREYREQRVDGEVRFIFIISDLTSARPCYNYYGLNCLGIFFLHF